MESEVTDHYTSFINKLQSLRGWRTYKISNFDVSNVNSEYKVKRKLETINGHLKFKHYFLRQFGELLGISAEIEMRKVLSLNKKKRKKMIMDNKPSVHSFLFAISPEHLIFFSKCILKENFLDVWKNIFDCDFDPINLTGSTVQNLFLYYKQSEDFVARKQISALQALKDSALTNQTIPNENELNKIELIVDSLPQINSLWVKFKQESEHEEPEEFEVRVFSSSLLDTYADLLAENYIQSVPEWVSSARELGTTYVEVNERQDST